MEQASSAFSTGVPALAAIPQLAGNSRQGFGLVDGTMRWASGWVISSNTLGLSTSLYDSDAGSRSTGKMRDTGSGLDYFEARYYSSAMGRFMSPDPLMFNELRLVNPQRWNMYAYAINSPLVFDDPSGLDAAVVTFTNQIPIVGHDGLLSVHPDGSVTFAQYGPAGGAKPYGVGDVQTLSSSAGQLPALAFDSNGYPTAASLSALTDKLAATNSVSPGSIKIAYFKTSSAETAALDQYIAQWVAASKTGKLRYFFYGANCANFCRNGMEAAGLPAFRNYGHLPGTIPNEFGNLWGWEAYDRKLKEKVTHRICDEHGQNCH